MFLFNRHYYSKKYSEKYYVCDKSGYWTFYTLPIKTIIKIYEKETGKKPLSFFDCGCATGHLLKQAEKMNMKVHGIDVKSYPQTHASQKKNIEISSIINYKGEMTYDIIFCNGTLTYLNEDNIDIALNKFKNSKMVIAIHNTIEDDKKAGGTEYRSPNPNKPRLIKSQKWWVSKFQKSGFYAKYDEATDCFIARPKERE